MMGFTQAISSCFGKYATFQGRARRSEYWFWQLFMWLGFIAIYLLSFMFGMGVGTGVGGLYGGLGGLFAGLGVALLFIGIFFLIILLPSFAETARRLHDSGKSAWLMLLLLIPYVGSLIIFILALLPSTEGPNQYGPQP